MSFLAQLIEDNQPVKLSKQVIYEDNHKLSVFKVETVKGKFGDQWILSVKDETSTEEGKLFFSASRDWFNNIMQGMQQYIEENDEAVEDVALEGKELEPAQYNKKGVCLKPAQWTFKIREWKASYEDTDE